jgi:fused signal recognition particle receptor
MFEKLKEKLGSFKAVLGADIEKEAVKTLPAKAEVVREEEPKVPEKIGVFEKIKAVVLEQEFIIDEKSLAGHLWELEMALLESDVALPVAEKIVESVKSELVGSRRKIGDRKSTRLNSSHRLTSRMPSSA